MRLGLKPQKRAFFELFTAASLNIVEISRLLAELLAQYPEDGRELIAKIKEREHEGDRLTTDLVGLVNRTFVTLFDRDDIFRLATALDDICDHVDDAATNLELYDVRRVPERAREQGNVINRAAAKLDASVRCLDGFKDANGELRGLRELEDEGDRLVRQAVAELFRSGQDPISIIRWRISTAARRGRGRVSGRQRRARGDPGQEPLGAVMEDLLLVVVIATALVFDFTNGFHDTANAVATSVSTRALTPRQAVTVAAFANLAGAFVTTAVAKTVGQGIIDTGLATQQTILAALLGAIAWTSSRGTSGYRRARRTRCSAG